MSKHYILNVNNVRVTVIRTIQGVFVEKTSIAKALGTKFDSCMDQLGIYHLSVLPFKTGLATGYELSFILSLLDVLVALSNDDAARRLHSDLCVIHSMG
jgi:hypothetical protein